MKETSTPYYFLFLVLMLGAFASMALNGYGIPIMTFAVLGFCLTFLYEGISTLTSNTSAENLFAHRVELFSLSALCLIIFLTGVFVDVPFEHTLVTGLSILLLGIAMFWFYQITQTSQQLPAKARRMVVLYFIALSLSWVSLYLFRTENSLGLYFAAASVACLACFLVFGWWKGNVVVQGEAMMAAEIINRLNSRMHIQLIGLTLIIGFFSLTTLNVFPPLYRGSLPNGYSKVVRQSEVANDPQRAKEFENAYRKFVKGK